MMKCLTFEYGRWSNGRWAPEGKATIHTDLIGAVVDDENGNGSQILGGGFTLAVNLPREKIVQMIRNAESGRLDFGVAS